MRHRYVIPAVTLLAATLGAGTAAAAPISYSQRAYVDDTLAGGEPLVLDDTKHNTLIYTSHEGTTHLYRDGITDPFPFATNYTNQVNVWYSDNNGKKWNRVAIDPDKSQGFSDPDLTQDAGGRVYNTGIDLGNDSVFSTADGGKTWDKGTAQCHDGDRPWLAGAGKDQVFLATDTVEGTLSHQIFESDDGGDTCSSAGIPDAGDTDGGGTYTGYGKLYWNPRLKKLVEPVIYNSPPDAEGNTKIEAIGAATWQKGQDAFKPVQAAKTSVFAHFPIVIFDSADTLYLIWDTDERQEGTAGGCDGEPTPAPNAIKMAVSHDFGKTWSSAQTIAGHQGKRVFWPWAVAGDKGKLSIVYYVSNGLQDPDCQTTTLTIEEARVTNADSPGDQKITLTDVSHGPIHDDSTVCQGGTTCVATGQDRRLGDFFTNALDRNGCLMVASGDTTKPAEMTGGPRPISLPILIRQTSGPSLTGKDCANPSSTGGGDNTKGGGRNTTGSCADHRRPKSVIRRKTLRVGARRFKLKGRASDRGCHKKKRKVKRVRVSIAKRVPRHNHVRCRYVKRNGRLGPVGRCHHPRGHFFRARGRNRWHFSKRVHLPAGRYVVRARAIDRAHNKERRRTKRNTVVVKRKR
jgi:hypothetical protein